MDVEVLPVARNPPPRLVCSGNGGAPLAIFGLTKSDAPGLSPLAAATKSGLLLILSSSPRCFIAVYDAPRAFRCETPLSSGLK